MEMIEWNDLEEILQKVEKPGRYLGGEWNSVKKKPDSVAVKVALAFPDLYEVGMSYLGQKILYHILNSKSHILAERVFAPWLDFEHELRSKNIPLFSLENRIPLDRFDIIGFSLLYELNYSNVLNMLDLGRIPLFSGSRGLEYPLVVFGGPAVFNPEPVADYCDLFVIGDGEEVFFEIIQSYMALKKESGNKNDILSELAKINGVYVPSLYESYQIQNIPLVTVKPKDGMPAKIKKRVLFPFQQAPFPEDIIVPNIQVIFDRVAWEVARGCPQNCRFCQASSIYFPPRVKSPSSVIKGILKSLRSTGYDSVSLASLSVSDYPYLEAIIRSLMKELERQKVSLSLSSLRPKGLTSEVAANIVRVRKTGFTLVPEAGTERLRAVINKCLKNDEIWEAVENAFSEGWKRLKLYFMIGLPTETEEDLLGIVEMVKEIHRIGRKFLKKSPQINLSISSFIPKPHTPFQWLRMEKKDILNEKFRFVLSHLKKYPSIRLKRDSLELSVIEGVFSRGDRRLNAVLHNAWKCGARFDSWDDVFRFSTWENAFESEKIDFREYLSELDIESVLPWDHIDTGLTKNHLLEEFKMALDGKSSPSCSEKDCATCQGCSLSKFYQKRFDESVTDVDEDFPTLGKRTEEVQRYRASFRKTNQARYLSHMDLNNIIQQGFRRAGISVSYSQGFHPKMLISYPPALPLGMEGKAEWIEFKSPYIFSEEEFVSRINPFLIEGVEFFGLRHLEETDVPMNRQIRAIVYSLDLQNKKVISAVKSRSMIEGADESYFNHVEKIMNDYFKKSRGDSLEKISVDETEGKLLLSIKNVPQKGEKPQEIVNTILGLENPVWSMVREQFLLDNQVKY
ncbi:MAG: TIGR03960 family B12-binding radical SAM protein [Candidatus Aminicenantaceae bacterium]